MSEDEAAHYLAQLEDTEKKYPGAFSARNRNNSHMSFPFIAESIVGANMGLSSTVLFTKEPKSTSYVSWHQDATYMGLTSSNLTTGWLALSHSNEHNGISDQVQLFLTC